jgi:dienelactone hydrolase
MKLLLFIALLLPVLAQAEEAKLPRDFVPPPFDTYFQQRVAELSKPDWQLGITKENWPARQAVMRKELQGMLDLDPWPARGDLKPVITGTVEGDGYIVEKLQFQSSPGLYVTANLFRPREVTKPLPAVLYVCGHSLVVKDGISLGGKTHYQHHAAWYARHGYVCLVIDTIELGEIRGEHHGTYNKDEWYWPARGYTSAGPEAWNGIRAIDYLVTRPEVDPKRIGVTGRSGGGAYSWWIAALDERVACAAPTAGIATLKNHVLDGSIEGHCDCMFMVNTCRWDFDRVAALVAPRALCIVNTDKDPIFPLDGVMEVYNRTRALYKTLGAEAKIGLQIAEGPHNDTQPLNTGEFHWMDRFLKGADRMAVTDEPMVQRHDPVTLRVFSEIPKDEIVTTLGEHFGVNPPPAKVESFPAQRDGWMAALKSDSFRAWPTAEKPDARLINKGKADGVSITQLEITTDIPIKAPLWILQRDGLKREELDLIVLNVLDDKGWAEFQGMAAAGFPKNLQPAGGTPKPSDWEEAKGMFAKTKWAMAYTTPRGAGETSFAALPITKRRQILRRFQLIGETLESGQVWDIVQAGTALRNVAGYAKVPLWIQAGNEMAANAVYASLFLPDVKRLDLHSMPASHWQGPTYLNVLRHLDLPQAVAMAAEHSTVALYTADARAWEYPLAVAKAQNWGDKRVQIRKPLEGE